MKHATEKERQLAKQMETRASDWRMGAIVYQVLVDRFVPSENIEAKAHLYASPKQLKAWSDTPKKGQYLPKERLWSHEIEFWGGDLNSLSTKLEYIAEVGADVLYLNPIHHAYTNHKYDSLDFKAVSPEFGTREDVKQLADKVHALDMKLVLDGVFNHMGQNAEIFKAAQDSEQSPYRDWFFFGEGYPNGYLCWDNAENLPELNVELREVRDYLYGDNDSVVKGYLADGVDGWRLDVAHDIGFNILQELTSESHKFDSSSLVIGEVWSYPQQWLESLDGIMNLTLRHGIIQLCRGEISPRLAAAQLQQMVADCDYEGLLKSWLLLDNHDTVRLPELLPDPKAQQLAQVLQFTLPGSPNLYYGSELGMRGGDDPEMRAPMDWRLVNDDNQSLKWLKHLVVIRKQNLALRYGDFTVIQSDKLLAFVRYTHKVEDTVIVVVNTSQTEVMEHLLVPQSKLMNMGAFTELLGSYPTPVRISASYLTVTMPAQSAALFKPQTEPVSGYTTYKRVL